MEVIKDQINLFNEKRLWGRINTLNVVEFVGKIKKFLNISELSVTSGDEVIIIDYTCTEKTNKLYWAKIELLINYATCKRLYFEM